MNVNGGAIALTGVVLLGGFVTTYLWKSVMKDQVLWANNGPTYGPNYGPTPNPYNRQNSKQKIPPDSNSICILTIANFVQT